MKMQLQTIAKSNTSKLRYLETGEVFRFKNNTEDYNYIYLKVDDEKINSFTAINLNSYKLVEFPASMEDEMVEILKSELTVLV